MYQEVVEAWREPGRGERRRRRDGEEEEEDGSCQVLKHNRRPVLMMSGDDGTGCDVSDTFCQPVMKSYY